jgi:hypothetical protein
LRGGEGPEVEAEAVGGHCLRVEVNISCMKCWIEVSDAGELTYSDTPSLIPPSSNKPLGR